MFLSIQCTYVFLSWGFQNKHERKYSLKGTNILVVAKETKSFNVKSLLNKQNDGLAINARLLLLCFWTHRLPRPQTTIRDPVKLGGPRDISWSLRISEAPPLAPSHSDISVDTSPHFRYRRQSTRVSVCCLEQTECCWIVDSLGMRSAAGMWSSH
jgi:hypothetical protein